MAQPAVDYAYRYAAGSRLAGDGDRTLSLATWDETTGRPRLFRGRVVHPVLFADSLLALGAVARARFHVPPAMLEHILRLADPVVTAGGDRLRFEAFSSDASVYARLDLLPGCLDGAFLGTGTTNVDLGAEVRAALAGVTDAARLDLEVGQDEVAVAIDGAPVSEQKVALPERWVRGFAEAQAIMAAMTPRFEAGGGAFRAFLRSLPKGAKAPVWVASRAGRLEVGHRPGEGTVPVVVTDRLRLLERLAPWAAGVRVHAEPGGASAWSIELADARFTLAISPEAWRGFSGEGLVLDTLARPVEPRVRTRVEGAVRWRAEVRPADLAAELGADPAQVESALARLAADGQLGFDLADGAYFARPLPFAHRGAEGRQPRLARARALVAAGAVRLEPAASGDGGGNAAEAAEIVGWVSGRSAEYRVRIGRGERACTCPWWGRHPGDRGPCSHIVAVQLVAAGDAAR